MPRVGLISDTHGLLRQEAVAFLGGSDFIIHAGDVGDATLIEKLETLAPVTVVRGNNDKGSWADGIAQTEVLQVNDVLIYVLHDIAELDLDPVAAGFGVVVFGHSHRPLRENRDGVLYVNPGSAGPRRFRLPVCVGELQITGGSVIARHVELEVTSGA
jgi:putative phosphoesterase